MRAAERNGFTLVEVLVALVVSALLLAILMSGDIAARERLGLAEQRREAVLLARELLARASILPFVASERRGASGKLAWEVRESAAARDPRGRFVLAALAVEVRRGETLLFAGETRALKTMPAR